MEAILLVGHGSRDSQATAEFRRLVELVRQRQPRRVVESAFLDHAAPAIADSLATCVSRGATTIAVVPGMLLAARHTKQDIPAQISAFLHGEPSGVSRSPIVAIHYGRPLYPHPKLIELCRLRCLDSRTGFPTCPEPDRTRRATRPTSDHRDTFLLVVARGGSDEAANAEVRVLARLLRDDLGYGESEACFMDVAAPPFAEALERCSLAGFGRVLVFPFFLFTGVLEKRLRLTAARFGREQSKTAIFCADYLNAHKLLADICRDRAEEAIKQAPFSP